MTTRPDPLDDVLREAHRRGQVVLMHPVAGPVLVTMADGEIDPKALDALERVDQMKPARPAGESR